MDISEQELLFHLKKGSAKAFERLYVQYKDSSVKFCYSIVKDFDEAESLIHDVFVQLWEKRETISISKNFKAYLFTCIKNKAFDHFKTVKKNENAIESQWHLIDKIQREQEEAEDEFAISSLISGIETLPEGRKEILRLRYFKGKSYQEIAQLLNISSNTVKNQLIKAKQYLRNNTNSSTSF